MTPAGIKTATFRFVGQRLDHCATAVPLLFYNEFSVVLYVARALCAHHQEVKLVLHSMWYHHTCRWLSGAQSSLNLRTGRPRIGVMIPDAV